MRKILKEIGSCVEIMESDIKIRIASEDDAGEILEIYAPYVKETAITFEYDVPDLAEFAGRIGTTLQKYPYLVAEKDGVLLGYAYAGSFVGRAAYDWAAEVTIYLKKNMRKMGLGKRLYQALEEICRAQNITNLYACIGCPEREDEYLTRNSMGFHAHMGYALVGEFHKCGYKFGRWYNMVWMEKIIGAHDPAPGSLIPFPELDMEAAATFFQ